MTRFSASRPEVGVEVVVGLAGDLEVGLLADPLPGERAAELVVHDLDLLVDQDVGQVERRVGDRVVDDPVGELVARLVEGVPLEALADLAREARPGPRSRPSTARSRRRGRAGPSRGAPELDLEVGLLAGEGLLP